MSNNDRLQMQGANGLIDAGFSIDVGPTDSFSIFLESEGGGRNRDYKKALQELLMRLSSVAATLDDCQVVSKPTSHLSEQDRRVIPAEVYLYPIRLSEVDDYGDLADKLTTPQARIGSTVQKGGNPRKRIMLRFTPKEPGVTVGAIESALDARPAEKRKVDRKDIAAGVTADHVEAALREWRRIGGPAFHEKYGTTRAFKYVIADPDGKEYDAKAILFGARSIAGLDGKSADFDGDRQTVMEPLQGLGYIVEDLQDDAAELQSKDLDSSEQAQLNAIQKAREFAGETDASVERRVRREQRLLREALALADGSHACALCGRTYPDRLLIAAHIKKRSKCTYEEKIDIPAVALIACSFGCDALFEHGYVVVTDSGIIESTDKSVGDEHLHEMVMSLHGRQVTNFNPDSIPYFTWHRKESGFA